MVVDIGRDTTDVSIVAKNTLVAFDTIEVAGRAFDAAIEDYMKKERNLHISSQQARQIKHKLAAVNEGEPEQSQMTVYGQDTASRLPRETSVTDQDINKSIQSVAGRLTSFLQTFLQSASADIAADVYTHGVRIVGGTARLPGLAGELSEALSLSVYEYDQPDQVIIRGLGTIASQTHHRAQPITDFVAHEPIH
jgi:rod shape-determining protein MreB